MIQYNKIYKSRREEEYLLDALNRRQISGDGYYTKMVEQFLTQRFDVKKAFMTTSATHALELAMMLINLQPGDEVIMPSFTFSSTANSVLLQGALPVFAEIDANTLNIDPKSISQCISEKTKAIIPVHYAGIACDMDAIMDIAQKYHLYVIEDAAQAVNARYKGKYLGSIGHMGCYSFHGTKNFVSGEGGSLCINMNNEEIIERADCLREKGTDRSRFLRGEIASYSWVDAGSSYSPSDLLMAVLYGQLQDMEYITARRNKIHGFYTGLLQRYVDRELIRITQFPAGCEGNCHIFYMLFPSKENRTQVMQKLQQKGINAVTHFVPLHSSPMGNKLGYRSEDLPITQSASQCILRLPIYPEMTEEDMEYIASCLEEILEEF